MEDHTTPDMFQFYDNKEHQEKFMAYHKKNPGIYNQFVTFTFQLIRAGREYYGPAGVVEQIRWNTAIKGKGTFKVNNNYAPGYARLFHRDYPEYKGFFRLRKLRSERNNDQTG